MSHQPPPERTDHNSARNSQPGEVSLLSYNARNLFTWGSTGRDRFRGIANLAKEYDLVLLQEDFKKKYHDQLVTALPHEAQVIGNPRRRWSLQFYGSGLSAFISRQPGSIVPVGVERLDFKDCWGRLKVNTLHDCWVNKGVLFVQLALGQETLGVVSLHLDAGETEGDQRARRSQLAQLQELLQRVGSEWPLIVSGDFNIEYGSAEYEEFLAPLALRLGLRDLEAGVSAEATEVVDYIFVRGGIAARLAIADSGIDQRFSTGGAGGAPLSDHPALFVRFSLVEPAEAATVRQQ